MKAVDTHADLLRQSASDVGNDHRLGANEAPPAIISMFLGEQLEDVVKQLVETGVAATCLEGGNRCFYIAGFQERRYRSKQNLTLCIYR